MIYAVINSSDVVVNLVRWDGVTPWRPLATHAAIQLQDGEECAKGWVYTGMHQPRFIEPQEQS